MFYEASITENVVPSCYIASNCNLNNAVLSFNDIMTYFSFKRCYPRIQK